MFGPTAMSYGMASAAVVALSLFANRARYDRHVDAVGSALMLFLFWSICNVLLILYGLPDALLANPPMDLIGTAVAGVMFARRPAIWKAGLSLTFLTQCGLAVAFWAKGLALHDYLLQDNILFAMELCFVALPGGLHVGSRLGHGLLHRRSRGRMGLSR